MPLSRILRRAPLILSLCIIFATALTTTALFPRILNATVNHALRTVLEGAYRAELRGIADVSLYGIAVESVLIETPDPSMPVPYLHGSQIRIDFDVLSIFRGAGLSGLGKLEIGQINVFLRSESLSSLRDRNGDDNGETGDTESNTVSAEKIANVEYRVAQTLRAIPAGITGPIAISVYEASQENRAAVTPTMTAGTLAFATGDLTVAPGTVHGRLTSSGYTVALAVSADAGTSLVADGWVGGPGIAGAARIDDRGATFSAEISPRDIQLPPPFSLPAPIHGFGSASISFQFDRESDQPPPPASSSEAAGATSTFIELQEGFRAVESLYGQIRGDSESRSTLPLMRATVTIRDVDPGRIISAFDGRPALPLFSSTVHTTQDGIDGSVTIDGGIFGTVSARGISVPLDQPRAVTITEIQAELPAGLTIPSHVLPPQLRSAAVSLGMAESGGTTVSLPAVSFSTSAERGVFTVAAQANRSDRFTISADGRVDVVRETVAFSSVQTLLSDSASALSANTSIRATWTELLSLEPFSPIPVGVDIRSRARLIIDDTEVNGDVHVTDGRIRILSLNVDRNSTTYALTGTGAGETPETPYIEATSGMYRLSTSHIRLAPGLVTVSGTLTPDGVAGSVEFQSVPVTGILSALTPKPDSAVAVASLPERAAPGRAITGGDLSGQVTFNTDFERPHFTATIRGEAMTVFGETGSFLIDVEQDTTSLEVRRGEIDLANLLRGSFSGRLPIALTTSGITLLNLTDSALSASLRSARFDTFFPRDEDELRPEGALTVQMELLENTGDLRAEIDFRVRPETVAGEATGFSGFGYERLTGTVRATEDRFDRVTIAFSAAADGTRILNASADARVPGLSKATPTRNIEDISWRLEGTGELPLEYIAPFLPGVVALTGTLSGQIAGSGTVATPTLSGRIAVRDGELRTAGPTPPVSAINGAIRFQEARFFTENLSAETGLSPFSVSVDGTLPVDGQSGTLTASLTGRNILVTTSPLLRVRADADLQLNGSFSEQLTLGGLVTIRDGLYSRDIPLIDFDTVPSIDPDVLQLFSVRNRFASRTALDIRVLADESFRIENNLYDGVFSSDLTLGGTLEVPRPRGRVFTDSGRLTLPLTTMRVEQAVLRFPRDRPFTPDLQARAATRLRDYQLSVAVTGTLPGVEVNVTSTPPLSQGDALVLLSTGFTPQELASSGNRAALAIGSRLGTQFVQSLVGTTGGDTGEELADRVSVLLGEGVSDSGAETIEIEFRLTEEDSWFLVFRRDRYERYNMDLAWRFWLD